MRSLSAANAGPVKVNASASTRPISRLLKKAASCFESLLIPLKKSPLPLPSTTLRACFSKEGLNGIEKNPSLKKRDRGRFDFEFSGCHRVEFLNELRRHH